LAILLVLLQQFSLWRISDKNKVDPIIQSKLDLYRIIKDPDQAESVKGAR